MKLLALDTSSDACSVALACGDAVASRHQVRPREHTRLLMPMIEELLDAAGIGAADLDGVILGAGPGSFIGVRIAASAAQGVCFAAGCKLLPVSSLAAVAAEVLAAGETRRVLVAQDARMNEVYLAGYEADASMLPVPSLPARLQTVTDIEDLPPGYAAAGAGWDRYPQLLAENRRRPAEFTDVKFPHAEALLRVGLPRWLEGAAIAPESLTLDYLRDRVARPPAGTSTPVAARRPGPPPRR